MKKRSFLSMVMALSMLVSTAVPVLASGFNPEILEGKTIEGWSALKKPKTTVVGPTDYDARTGEWSLCAVFDNGKTYQQEWLNTSAVTLKAGKTYEIGVWAKVGSFDEEKLYKRVTQASAFAFLNGTTDTFNFDKIDTTPVDGWYKYYLSSYTPSKDYTGGLSFGFDADYLAYAEDVKVLFDDFYVVEKGTDTNIVYNGSFEEKVIADPEAPTFNPEIISEKTMEDWSALKNTDDGNITVVGATDYAARTGELSLCAIFQNSKTWRREYIETTTSTVSLKAGTEYAFGVWCKYDEGINPGKSSAFIGIGSLNTTANFDYFGETTDGWRLYYGKITPEKDVTGKVIFGFDANFSAYTDATETKVLFDDLYLKAAGTDENLIYNGSFEEELPRPEVPSFNPEIISGKTMEDWSALKNTDDGNITVVGPTDYAARTGELSLCAIFQNSKTWRREYIETTTSTVSLKAGKEYTFGVWCKYDEGINPGKSSAFIGIGSLNTTANFDYFGETTDGWRLYYGKITPEKDVTGKVIFGFDANFSSYTDATETKVLFDDLYIIEKDSDVNLVKNGSFEETVPLPPFEPEIVTGARADGWSDLMNNDDGNFTIVGLTDYDAKTGDWSLCATFDNLKTYRKEYIQNTNAQVTLKAGVEYSFGVWYKVGDGQWRTGSASSAFMGVGSVDGSKDFDKVVTTAENGWFKYHTIYTPSKDITGYLYFGFDANYGSFAEDTKVLFDDLYAYESGSTENLVYNGSFEIAEEVEPEVPAVAWEVEGFEFNLTADGETVKTVEALEPGEILGGASIINNSNTDLDVTVAVALYKDGQLVEMNFAEQKDVPVKVGEASLIGASVTVPNTLDSGNYEMKVFVWDSFANMKALTTPGSLTE